MPGRRADFTRIFPLDPNINQKSIINPKNQKVMAIYFAGYLSPIRNKLGNAVGRKWRTLDVLAVYNGRPRNPRTEKQQINRTIFGAAASLSRSFKSAVMLGFKNICDGTPIPQGSMFIKKNWNCITCDTPGAATVDYTEIVVAEGALPEAGFGAASFADPLSVEVPLTDTSEYEGASAQDEVYIFVYSPEASAGRLSEKALRNAESITCDVPSYWVGHRVHVWGFAIGHGNDNMGIISMSRYLGSGTIS